MQCYPTPYPPHFQGEGSFRGPVFDRLKQLVHDRLGQHQSGQGQNPGYLLERESYPSRYKQREADNSGPPPELLLAHSLA